MIVFLSVRGMGRATRVARGGTAMCWRVTASRHWCHGVVRVQRGLRRRGGDVVWATARRSCTRVAGACWAAAWAAPRELAAQARVGTADCIAGGCKGCIRAAEQRFCNRFPQRAVWTTQWCCTRARGGRGLRDAELHVEILVCQTSLAGRTRTSTFRGPGRGTATPSVKARARRHTYGRRAHPRNTPLVTAASTERLRVCSGRDAATR